MDNIENRTLSNIIENNTKLYLTLINTDYSNIDQVYNNNFSKIKDTFNLSEVDFIDSELKNIEIFFIHANTIQKQQLQFYSIYLSKKRSNVHWTLNDFYNHYTRTKRFGLNAFIKYKSNEYSLFIKKIETCKIRYQYIFEKLSNIDKIEFKNDFCDQLEHLKNRQIHSKFKELIEELKKSISDNYNSNRSNNELNNTENIIQSKETVPFKVGVEFAKGTPQNLYEKYKKDKGHFLKICKELGFKDSDRPYFSQTLNDGKGDKNIYSNFKNIQLVYKYCLAEKITICQDFSRKVKESEDNQS